MTAGFVIANLWFDKAIQAAVLVAGFAALVLYILSMWSLLRLRRREPELLTGYRAPLGTWLPLCVIVLSVIALAVYPRIDEQDVVVPVALGMYAVGIAHHALRGRKGGTEVQEVAAATPPVPGAERRGLWLHRAAVVALVVAVGVLGAVTVAAFGGPDLFGSASDRSALLVLGVIVAALAAVSAVELWQTRAGGGHGTR